MAHLATPPNEQYSRSFFDRLQPPSAYVSFEGDTFGLESRELRQRLLQVTDDCRKTWTTVLPHEPSDDSLRTRGVIAVRHGRSPLFTQSVSLDPASPLPKWKPKAHVSRRVLEDDDA